MFKTLGRPSGFGRTERVFILLGICVFSLFAKIPAAPIQLDPGFNIGTGASSTVYDIVSQVDGTLWIGGSFSTFNGTSRYGVVKLSSDGTVDPSFNTPSSVSANCVVPLADGKILIGMSSIGSGVTYRQGIARLNSDGSIDTTFNAGTTINSSVFAIEVLADGKILIGGSFTKGIAKLASDGSTDPAFTPGTGISGTIQAIHTLPSGGIVIGGSFSSYNGVSRNNLCRLQAGGVLDTSFGSLGSGPGGTVHDIEKGPDDKLYVAGQFSTVNGLSRDYVALISANGVPDPGFIPDISSTVYSIARMEDGRILVGGDFTTVEGITRQRIALLHADGKPDPSFDSLSGASGSVRKIRKLGDDRILLGGSFSTVATVSSKNLAKLNAPDTASRPAIGWISHKAAGAGTVIRLLGSGFSIVTSVEFAGGIPALFTYVSSTEITATVPVGALSGAIALKSENAEGASASIFYPLPLNAGTIDPFFDVGSGAGSTVHAIARDSAGRVVIAGDFSSVNGLNKSAIARLGSDGSVDTAFNPPSNSSYLRAIAIQPDGKLLVGGSSVGGRSGIARLHQDGSMDDSFNATGTASSYVYTIAMQPDGKILVGGSFTRRLARLNSNGSQDLTFDVGSGMSSDVNAIRIQPDGKILVAGAFTTYNGSPAKYLTRLTSNGAIDPTFQINGTGISGTVETLALQNDGKIVFGGSFYSINGKSNFANLARLQSNGTLDDPFLPEVNSTVNAIEITPKGRIAIGGGFTSIKGLSRNYAALLHADGSLDSGFNTAGGPSGAINAVRTGDDGSLVIGGSFTKVAGQPPAYIARLAGDDGKTRPAIASISPTSGAAGDRVVIYGSNLGSLTGAEFSGGSTALIFPDSELRTEVQIPADAMSGPITLRNAYGETTSQTIFKLLSNPVPVITSIPTSPIAVGGTFTVTGRNFHDVTSVRVGVLTAAYTVNSATEMTVTVPAKALTAPVILSGPGGTAVSGSDLSVIKALSSITSAATASGVIGKSFSFGVTATNNPSGFASSPLPPGLVINPATGLISGIPTADGVTAVALSVNNEGGTANGNLTITISPPPSPVVSSIQPAYVPAGGRILVAGDWFFQTSSVTVGGVAALFEVISDSQIAVTMPEGVSSGVVTVTTQQGTIASTSSVSLWDFQSGSQVVTGFGSDTSGERSPPSGLDDAIAIAAGPYHSLALRADGRVTGWGANWSGQSVAPPAMAPASAIAAGAHHSLAILANGSLAAWGRNDEGQCTSSLTDVAAIAAGSYHSLALTRNGTVKAWGANWFGQSNVPSNLGGVVAIAAGGDFSLALKSDGTVVAWGDDSFGQITVPAAATGIVAISTGQTHAVALKSDGTLVCWGANWSSQCTPPAGLSQVVQITSGSHHNLALLSDGTCAAWGANGSGQTTIPAGVSDAIAVAAGGEHSLILHASSPAPRVTTGLIATGKPGQSFALMPTTSNGPFLFSADGLPTGLAISQQTGAISGTPTRGGDFIVTLTARNSYGISRHNLRLIIGPYIIGWGTSVPSPIPQTLNNIVKVAAGTNHCLALLNDGTVTGWGNNSYFQTSIPAGLTDVVGIAAGEYFSLALKSDGTVHAWGRNPSSFSQNPLWTNPIATGVVAIDANGISATALMNNGSAKSIVNSNSFYSSAGSDLIAISNRPSSGYSSYSDSFIGVNRSGFIVSYSGAGLSTSAGFDQVAISGYGNYYSSSNPPSWGVQRDGKLQEIHDSRFSTVATQFLRPETSLATDIAAGNYFAIVLNSDNSATALPALPDSDDPFPSSVYTAPVPTSDALVQIGAIAARNSYALAVKDPVARARFTSVRVTEGKVGQFFAHQPATSSPASSFSAALLPAGLAINTTTGRVSGTPTTAGTFNFLVIARYTTYFTSQVVSAKFTQGVAPVDMSLTNATVAENLPVGSPVGTLSAMDYSPSDTFTYSLVTGPGSTDNSSFKISGNQLQTNKVLDHESKPQAFVRIQVTDSGRNTFAKVFQIAITGVTTDDDDQDGLTQAEEVQLGTDRNQSDTDQDGVGDGQEIAAATNPLSAASKPANYVSAWGNNTDGQCNVPVNLGPVIAVTTGSYHSLAVRADGTVAAWGRNTSGQCDVPSGLGNVISVAAGYGHSVALKADGTVVAWGDSSYDLNAVPAGLSDVIEISANDYLTVALKSNGQVVVWGSTSDNATIVPAAAQGSIGIAAGYGQILALNGSGTTVAWGDDWQGQVTGPLGRKDLIGISAGDYLSLGLTTDGRVLAWGWDIYDATVVPSGLENVIHLSAGAYFSLAVRTDGRIDLWGNNSSKQLDFPVGLGPVQMADAGYGHVVALVEDSPQERFLTNSMAAVTGLPMVRQLAFSGMADRFSAVSLPPGLSFDPLDGTITGTPTRSGTFHVRFTAEKGLARFTRIIPIECEALRSFNEWKSVVFSGSSPSDTITGPLSDPDGDSVCNLIEYALHRDPLVPDQSPPVNLGTIRSGETRYIGLTYERRKGASDFQDRAEVSGDLLNWQSGGSATVPVEIIDHGDTETVTIRDSTPISPGSPRFIRLAVDQVGSE